MMAMALNNGEILNLKSNFHSPFPIINAVAENKQDGNIYILPDCIIVMHKCGFAYCEPKSKEVNYNNVVEYVLEQNTLPPYFHVYDAPPALVAAFSTHKATFNLKERKRIQLKFSGDQQRLERKLLPQGFVVEPITVNNINALAIFNLQLEEKFWRSAEDFLQHGFGYAVFSKDGAAAALCYGASIAGNEAEIDVATMPDYRQQGLAKIALGAFMQHCIKNNIKPNWDCFEDNIGSLNTAKSLGFKEVNAFNFLSIYKVLST